MPKTLQTDRLRRELKAARDIAALAEDQGRQLTTAEKQKVEAHLAKAKEIRKAADGNDLGQALDDLAKMVEGIEGGTFKSRTGGGRRPVRVGTASRTAEAPRPWSSEIPDLAAKSLVPSGTLTVPLLIGDIAGIGGPRSLIGSVIPLGEPLEGTDQFSYLRQTVRTNNAAPVARSALKPTSVVSLEKVDDRARTIATLSEPIPESWIADVSRLEQFLDMELAGMVTEEINSQILNGDGTGENLGGILNTANVQVQAWSTDLLQTVRKAKTKIGLAFEGLVADTVLLHPLDAERLDLTQDLDGRYYFRGPIAGGPDDPLWKTEVFETTAIAEGVGLIGAFRAATEAVVRDEVKVDWSTAPVRDLGGGDWHSAFETNERIYRAEARVGLKISRPAALVQFATTASESSGS